MRKDRIKSLEKSVVWVLLISGIIVSSLYFILQKNKYTEYGDKISSYIQEREYELAESILEKTNLKSTENAFKVIQSFNASAYIVSDSNKAIFEWPNGASAILKSCKNTVNYSLTRGIPVGKVEVCLSSSKIAKSTFTTGSFLTTLFLVMFSLAVLSSFILVGYRKSLEKSLDSTMLELTAWNRDSNKKLNISSDDRLTNKILNLVKQGFETRLELSEVKADFDKEKEVNKVIRQVAHDIRDPIRSVVTNINLVNENLDDTTKKVINYSLERIEETFDDILKTKRKSNEDAAKRAKIVDVKPILESLVERKKELYSDINFQLITPEKANALCSPPEFKRVISNVVNNSIESLDKGKKDITIEVVPLDSRLQITLTDNGKGIPSEYLDVVFEEDFTSGKENGNGLGLFYASKKMEEWNGEIGVRSEIGSGTELKMEFQTTL